MFYYGSATCLATGVSSLALAVLLCRMPRILLSVTSFDIVCSFLF